LHSGMHAHSIRSIRGAFEQGGGSSRSTYPAATSPYHTAHLTAKPIAATLHKLLAILLPGARLFASDVGAPDAAAGADKQRPLAKLTGPVLLGTVFASLTQIEPAIALLARCCLLSGVPGHRLLSDLVGDRGRRLRCAKPL